jgi:cytochrome oxidase Cu insertion factor (SCO1/SenC/PrrC family)
MSGSESSAPADLRRAAPEALGLTVHALPAPVIDERRRRVLGGRLRMLTILLACAAPVIASYLTYYVVRPQGRTNYSTLVSPSRSLPDDLGLRTLDGAAVASASLRGQWLMVLVGPAACDAACERRIYLQRQLREMLGRERDRVERVWLVTDDARPSPALLQAAQATGPLTVLHADPAALARWLAPEAGHTLAEHLYVVDPMGEWMMRSPADPEPKRLKSDLERLLRASSSWDRAGR